MKDRSTDRKDKITLADSTRGVRKHCICYHNQNQTEVLLATQRIPVSRLNLPHTWTLTLFFLA
jgi:hypothetical protein